MVKELHECAVLAPDASHGIPLVNARPKMNNPFRVGYENNQMKSTGGEGGGAEGKVFPLHFPPPLGLFFFFVKLGFC